MKKTYDNKAIRDFIRANRHYTDSMVAHHFDVSTRVVSANKAHITMGTDMDHPQERRERHSNLSIKKKQIPLIKTSTYQLIIDEDGQFHRCDLVKHTISKLNDSQAKALMINRLIETYNNI